MYNAITSMYHVVKARVRAGGELSDAFMCPLGLKQGEVCSPVLFSLFINELASEIINKGKHGVQLIPDLLELLILMFADDVILLSDSITGLQNQLNVLCDTALSLGLTVNLDKSNIVVFRNGGYLSLKEKWFYGGSKMNVVNMYKYLGVILSTKLSFSHMLYDIANKGKRRVINIFKLLRQTGERSPKIFFKMFDAQIQPILSYGAEVWGLVAKLDVIEKVHTFALKRFLNVSIRTPNASVYGELGRFPLYVNMYIKSIKYWLKILKLPEHRLPLKAYRMLLFLHQQNRNTWASTVCSFLYKHGFQEVWENQGVGNEREFVKLLRSRLIVGFQEQWSCLLSDSERFSLFRTFKSSISLSPYLLHLKHIQARISLIRLRLGVSQLNTHKLRFKRNVTNRDLSCPFCPNQEESEFHFVLLCPRYADLRQYYIPSKYYNNPCAFKLTLLLANENKYLLMRLAVFLHKAFIVREM